MITAKSVQLENFVVYDKARYDFKDGITVIRGENRSGKSVLFSALGNLLYGTPPILKSSRKAKEMHVRSGSKVQFDCVSMGREVSIVQGLHGQSLKYSIFVDGQDMGSLLQGAGQDLIRELIPTPEDLFYSSVYVAGARPHPLHLGTGADRMRYLENMFSYHKFDNLRSSLSELLSETKKAVSEAEALKAELASLSVTNWTFGPSNIDKLLKASNQVRDMAHKQNAADRLKADRDAVLRQLEDFPKQQTAKELERSIRNAEKRLEDARNKLSKSKHYEEMHKRRKNYVVAKAELDGKIASLKLPKPKSFYLKQDLNSLSNKYDSMKAYLYRIQRERHETVKDHKDYEESRHRVMLAIESYGLKLTPKFLAANFDRLKYDAEETLSKFERNELIGTDCPTCLQPVNAKPVSAREGQKARNIHRLCSKFSKKEIATLEKPLKPLPTKLKKLEEDEEKLKEKIGRLKQQIKLAETVKELTIKTKSFQDQIDQLSEFSDPMTGKEGQDKVSSISSHISRIKQQLKLQVYLENINKKIVSGSVRFDLNPHSVDALRDAVSEVKSDYSIMNKTAIRKRKIEDRLRSLGKAIESEDILSALVDAYGPRGLRVNQMKQIAGTLERSFNQFAPSIFPEPIYFNFDVAPSRVTVGVENNGLRPSDSSSLSGSEVRCFQILCFAALSPYIPSRFRFDTVILDEVEAMMTPATRQLYTQVAIPEIAKAVRSVTIVTPLPEEEMFIDNSRSLQIVKDRFRSRIEEVK